MNERIKQLAEQAGMVVGSYANDGSDVWMEGLKTPGALEKFAELIVRECADVATVNQYQAFTPGHYVKKHFGVEE